MTFDINCANILCPPTENACTPDPQLQGNNIPTPPHPPFPLSTDIFTITDESFFYLTPPPPTHIPFIHSQSPIPDHTVPL